MSLSIRIAEANDAKELLDIYPPFVRETAVTFEYDLPAVEEFSARIKKYIHEYPWLVCDHDGKAIGYAYASSHRTRKAYQWSVEVSVYIHHEFRRRGIAAKLYEALFELLRLQGIINVYAGIALPNSSSE